MTFDMPTGSRGGRKPVTGGVIGRRMTGWAKKQIRRKGRMPGIGFNALVLTTIGAKSGQERTSAVGWFPGEDGSRLIVASAAGARQNPAWYHNVAAHPDRLRIETAGRAADVVAEELHGEQRERAWRQIVKAAPQFAKYQEKTDRVLPIIRLVERPG
jgi:deazaflavin-dependent oxidoreductase (nitroreductase family)